MKKLTRSLCFLLVVSMLVGLFTVGAFATNRNVNYTDTDAVSVEGAEAIDVLTGLGVLNGFEDGTYGPDGSFTREQAAKILAYLVAGPEVAASLTAATDPFEDVAKDRWSAPYVSFASEKRIVVGYDYTTTFGPEDILTRDQWVKMLLVAIGYDPVACGLEGGYWAENTRDLAMTIGLIKAGELSEDFDREWAAIYAWRALFMPLKNVEYTITDANGITRRYTTTLGEDTTLNDKNFGAFFTDTESDPFYRPYGINWYVESARGPILVATTSAPQMVANGHVKFAVGDVLTDDIGLNAAMYQRATVEIYVDGALVSEDKAYVGGGNGTVYEVYDMGGGLYRFVVINTYIDVLADDDVVEADKYVTAHIYVDNPYDDDAEVMYETDAFAAGDVVLYNYSLKTDAAYDVHLAPSVTGVINTVVAGTSFTFDNGDAYELGANTQMDVVTDLINKRTYIVYVDDYGYAMLADVVRFSTENVYVLGMRARATYKASADNLFEADSSALAQAMVIDLESGEVKVVNIKTVNYLGGYYYSDVNGEPSSLAVLTVNTDVSSNGLVDGTIYTNRNQMYIPVVNGGSELNNRGFYQMTTIGDEVVFTAKYDTYTVTTELDCPVIELASNEDEEDFDDNVHTDSETVIKNVVYYPDGSSEVKITTLTGYESFVDHVYNNAMVVYEEADGAGYKIVHEVVNVDFAMTPRTIGFYIGKNLEGGTDGIPETSIDRDIYYFIVKGEIIGRYANDYSIYGDGEDVYGEKVVTDKSVLDELEAGTLVKFIDYADVWTVYDVEELTPSKSGVVIDQHQDEYVVLDDDTIIKLNGKLIIDENGNTVPVTVGDELSVYPGAIINHGAYTVDVIYYVDDEEYASYDKTLGTYDVIDAPDVEEYQEFDGWYDADGNEVTSYTIEYGSDTVELYGTIGVAEGWYALTLNIQNNANEPTETAKFDTTVIYVQEYTPLTDPFSTYEAITDALDAGYAYTWYEEYDEETGLFSTEFTFDDTTVMDDNITLYCRFSTATEE